MMVTQHLNPLSVPILGTSLIEASAGTGKTWNIAALYARLVILEQMPVDRILVVTFTKAATAELKMRLRARLDGTLGILLQTQLALNHLQDLRNHCGNDEFIFDLLQQALNQEKNKLSEMGVPDEELNFLAQQRLQLRLKAAISDFDHAAIYTIHGFCQRILQDFAFYCQEPFTIELDEQGQPEYQLIAVQDFWRQRVIHNENLAYLVYQLGLTPEKSLQKLKHILARPYLKFKQDLDLSQSFLDLQQQLQSDWQKFKTKLADIQAAFEKLHPALNGQKYRKATYEKIFNQLNQLSQDITAQNLIGILGVKNDERMHHVFSSTRLKDSLKKDPKANINVDELIPKVAQFDELFDLAKHIVQIQQDLEIALEQNLIEYLRETHAQHKQENPERQFDDLLLDVFDALQPNAPHAEELAHVISEQWQVALIDEFQDTDPLQYDIFRRIFAQAAKDKPGHALFLVGDPKQAIYSFRGADIFAYLQAAKDDLLVCRYTIGTNYRSHARLVNSIHALFAQVPMPFALADIHYPDVQADRSDSHLIAQNDHAVVLHWFESSVDNIDALRNAAAENCAEDIAYTLLSGTTKLKNSQGEEKPIHAGQIAVLVRKRDEGRLIQQQLKQRGIQSVLLSQDSVFGEEEAQALYALMGFILNPLDSSQLVYVLAGCLFDYTAEQLLMAEQNNALLAWIDEASEAMAIWQQHGIYSALQTILSKHQVEKYLLSQKRERALTNLYQLLELIASEERNHYSPAALYQWLGTQIQDYLNQTASHALLRLESDENLVKIVTIHSSKGLQYPIVYCPFIWSNHDHKSREWYIVHQQNQALLVHKKQVSQEDKTQIELENLSEELRLLYVALTRAEEQLHLYLTERKNIFNYLLNNADEAKLIWDTFLDQQDKQKTDFAWHQTPEKLTQYHDDFISEQPIYRASSYPKRSFTRITHTSFTGLTQQLYLEHEFNPQTEDIQPTLDVAEQQIILMNESISENEPSFYTFPKGTRAGVCLHEILEYYLDIPNSDKAAFISDTLQKYGYDVQQWQSIIWQMAEYTVQTPLLPQLNLAMLPKSHRLTEMGFLFHSHDFALNDVKAWLQQPHFRLPEHIIQASRYLQFSNIEGFISGFIDLFVYTPNGEAIVIDYKSNYLGNRAEDYQLEALNQAIGEHHYYLQAFIYAIAVTRYLNSRQVYPKQIAIRYLFLRGLDGLTHNGVWSWDIQTQDLQPWL